MIQKIAQSEDPQRQSYSVYLLSTTRLPIRVWKKVLTYFEKIEIIQPVTFRTTICELESNGEFEKIEMLLPKIEDKTVAGLTKNILKTTKTDNTEYIKLKKQLIKKAPTLNPKNISIF